jgi:hypothetical protein
MFNPDDYQINFFYFKSQGFYHNGNSFIVVPDSEKTYKLVNITKYAMRFAQIPKCLSVFIFDSSLEYLKSS